jgi:hypothetical protein
LDGSKVGSTSPDQASLIIESSAGRHSVEIRKTGFMTQSFSIEVEIAKVKQLKVAPFQPSIQIGESGTADEKSMERKTGNLKLQTIPVECVIDIPQLGLTNKQKSKADWYAKDIPIGKYMIDVTAKHWPLPSPWAIFICMYRLEHHHHVLVTVLSLPADISIKTALDQTPVKSKK